MSIRALGGALLVEGVEELRLVKWALFAGVREHRSNGIATRAIVAEALVEVENALCVSLSGRQDVRIPEVPSESVTWIGTRQAAELLGVTQRHVTRIATSLEGRKVGRAWVFPEVSVLDYRDLSEDARDDRPRAA